MAEQEYVEVPIRWVGHQWDGDLGELGVWVLNHDANFFSNKRVLALPKDPKSFADLLHPTDEEIVNAEYDKVLVNTPNFRGKKNVGFELFAGIGSFQSKYNETALLGEWILYSPQLDEYRVVNDDEFHRRFTAKV